MCYDYVRNGCYYCSRSGAAAAAAIAATAVLLLDERAVCAVSSIAIVLVIPEPVQRWRNGTQVLSIMYGHRFWCCGRVIIIDSSTCSSSSRSSSYCYRGRVYLFRRRHNDVVISCSSSRQSCSSCTSIRCSTSTSTSSRTRPRGCSCCTRVFVTIPVPGVAELVVDFSLGRDDDNMFDDDVTLFHCQDPIKSCDMGKGLCMPGLSCVSGKCQIKKNDPNAQLRRHR